MVRGYGRGMGMSRGMGHGRGMGRGMGMGGGMGMGASRAGGYPQGNYPDSSDFKQPAAESMSSEQELATLKEQAKILENQMREINARISTLEEGQEVKTLFAEVDKDKCTGCFRCSSVCPTVAISRVDDIVMVDRSKCTGCGQCIPVCPEGAIILKKK